jgi:hypothetical protein
MISRASKRLHDTSTEDAEARVIEHEAAAPSTR